MSKRKLTEEEKRDRLIDREIAASLREKTPEQQERQRELHRLQQARWAKANPECISEAQKKWRVKQPPELFREYDAKRYARHAEKIKARRRAYYWANRERILGERRAKAAAVLTTDRI